MFASRFRVLALLVLCLITTGVINFPSAARGEDNLFTGTLDGELVPNTENMDQIIFRPLKDMSKVKFVSPPPTDAKLTAGRLYDPLRDKSAILTLLVLAEDEQPFIYADVDLDNSISDSERFPMQPENGRNPYILQTIIRLPFKNALFQNFPIIIQYFKDVRWDELKEGETLLMQSKEAFALGKVDIGG
ncbi:MAG TPA: hypothetical protein VFH91_01650, partial [Pyrinomonadaceae bacterium]|nr:hypothetical protein [Pyrinomonadaceae bacterium]